MERGELRKKLIEAVTDNDTNLDAAVHALGNEIDDLESRLIDIICSILVIDKDEIESDLEQLVLGLY